MLSMLLMDAFILFIPLSIGVAVLRAHLFDTDVIINRTLVYGSLTAILVLVYFGGVTMTQSVSSKHSPAKGSFPSSPSWLLPL
jgi:hypothetical protein